MIIAYLPLLSSCTLYFVFFLYFWVFCFVKTSIRSLTTRFRSQVVFCIFVFVSFCKNKYYILLSLPTLFCFQDPSRCHSLLPLNLGLLCLKSLAKVDLFCNFQSICCLVYISSPMVFHLKYSHANWRFDTSNIKYPTFWHFQCTSDVASNIPRLELHL